jgi:hypothetical protein
MCCGHSHHGGPYRMGSHHSWCCCFPRRFISSGEEKERLERYREQLKKELAGVEERLKEMG